MAEPSSPPSLRVAAAVAAAEGATLVVLAILQVLTITGDRMTMGVTTSAFFAGYGVVLVLCARGLVRSQTWARGPVVLTQLITLGLAWNFAHTLWLAIVLAAVAATAVAALVHPRSLAALADNPMAVDRQD